MDLWMDVYFSCTEVKETEKSYEHMWEAEDQRETWKKEAACSVQQTINKSV